METTDKIRVVEQYVEAFANHDMGMLKILLIAVVAALIVQSVTSYVLTQLHPDFLAHLREDLLPAQRTVTLYLPALPGTPKPDLGVPLGRYTADGMED